MTKVISILDYGAGNIHSVANALSHLGFRYQIIHNCEDVSNAHCLLVPGQGAFVHAMDNLDRLGLREILCQHIAQEKPYMGICLGFQILFESSHEHGGAKGLGIYSGVFEKFDANRCVVPHMGWNQLHVRNVKHPFWPYTHDEAYVYFDHSYYLQSADQDIVLSTCDYDQDFVAVIADNRVLATQFHPEKSGDFGLAMMKQFFSTVL